MGRVIRSHGRGWRRAQHTLNDRIRRKFAHVVNLNMLVRQRHTRLPEQAFDGTWMTGGNAQPAARSTLTQGRQSRVPMRRHFTEIGDTFKTRSTLAKLAEYVILHTLVDHLGIGTAAVQKRGQGS
jgi:hypothetical protein